MVSNYEKKTDKRIDLAKEYLQDKLSDGPVLASEAIEEALEMGIKKTTLHCAKEELGYLSQEGFNKQWWWYNPNQKLTDIDQTKWLEKYMPQLAADSGKEELIDDILEDLDEERPFSVDDETDEYYVYKRDKYSGAIVSKKHYDNIYQEAQETSIYHWGDVRKEERESRLEDQAHEREYRKQHGHSYKNN